LQDNEAIKVAKHIFGQVKKKFNLKMVDKKVLKDDKQVANYVVKYITKTLYSGVDTPFHTQYKRYFSKYRFFSSSKFKNNTSQIKLDKVYIYLSKNYPTLLEEYISDKEIPLYIHLENYINEKVVFETKTTQYTQTNYKNIYKQIDSLKMVNLSSNYIAEHIEFNFNKFQNIVLKKSIDLAYDKDTGEVIYINDYKMGQKMNKKQLVEMIRNDE
jgi:predicted HTH domain antitoxin